MILVKNSKNFLFLVFVRNKLRRHVWSDGFIAHPFILFSYTFGHGLPEIECLAFTFHHKCIWLST